MTLEYDLDVRALYIRLSDCRVSRTASIGDNAAVDLDESGRVTGIEVVSADHPWPLGAILRDYPVGDQDAARLRAYFPPDGDGMAAAQAPVMSVAAAGPSSAQR